MKLFIRIIFALSIVVLAVFAAILLSGNDLGFGTFLSDEDNYSDLLTYDLDEAVTTIHLDFDVRRVNVTLTDDMNVSLDYHAHEDDTWTFDVTGDTLSVTQKQARTFWFFRFGSVSEAFRTVNLYLPRTIAYDLLINNDVGDIVIDAGETVTIHQLDIDTDTGTITLDDVIIEEGLDIHTSTGRITLSEIVAGSTILDVSTGRISVSDFTFESLEIDNSTGDIILEDGSVLGALEADNSTGKISLDEVLAPSYDLKTSTGSIDVTLASWDDIALDLKTDVGSITVLGDDQGKTHIDSSGSITLKARVSTGSIRLED